MKVWSKYVSKTETDDGGATPEEVAEMNEAELAELHGFDANKVMRLTLIDLDGDTNVDVCGIDLQVDHHHGTALRRWLLIVKERKWLIVARLRHEI